MNDPNFDSLIGREIDGYRVEKLLGRGGMARVYRAFDDNLHRFVALKVIDPRTSGDINYQERFKKEARAIAQLRHQNIVGVHRFGQLDGHFYMAMDYIDGADLRWIIQDYHSNRTLIPYDVIRSITEQIARALDVAHKQGIIHRDIKPSNIMIDKEGNAILTDFGLVHIASEETKGEIFGSPHYIAPEQAISSANVVPQTDLYSLGVILYEMLVGKLPYTMGSAMEIAMAHMIQPLPDPLTINPKLDPAFVGMLKMALAKEPQNRYLNGAKLIAALRQAVKQAKERGGDRSTPSKLKYTVRSSDSTGGSDEAHLELAERVSRFKGEIVPPQSPALTPSPSRGVQNTLQGTYFQQISVYDAGLKASRKSTGRGRLRGILLLLLLGVVLGGIGFVALQIIPTLPNRTASAFYAPDADVSLLIEGNIEAVDEGARQIVLYGGDLRVQIANDDLFRQMVVGAYVRISGRFSESDTGDLVLVSYSGAVIDATPYPPSPTPLLTGTP